MWAKLKNLEYRDLFWILMGSVLGQHIVKAINKVATTFIENYAARELMPTKKDLYIIIGVLIATHRDCPA